MGIQKYIFILLVALLAFFPKPRASASHITEDLFHEVYRELLHPFCLYSNQEEGTSLDCDNPDPAVYECWHEKLHMRYDEAGILALMEEIRASNQKYPYYNEPYYNEFLSNRNWDNLMDFSDRC